jgi:hypothetical protein
VKGGNREISTGLFASGLVDPCLVLAPEASLPICWCCLRQERRHAAVGGRLPAAVPSVGPRAAAAALLAGRQPEGQDPAAGGAGGVPAQPLVDAGGVEAVPAGGQHAHGLALLELRQADGALLRRRGRLPRLLVAAAGGGVRHGGDLAEHRLLDAPVGGGGLPAGPAAPAGAPRHEADAEDGDHRAEQRGEHDHHVVVAGDVRPGPAGPPHQPPRRAVHPPRSLDRGGRRWRCSLTGCLIRRGSRQGRKVTSVCERTGRRGEGVALPFIEAEELSRDQSCSKPRGLGGVWSREIVSNLTWFSYVFNIFPSCSR